MMCSLNVGDLVYVYQNPERRGHMCSIGEVAEIITRDKLTQCRMTKESLGWVESSHLAPAERPPEGTVTKYQAGDRVECFTTHKNSLGVYTIEYVVWFEGQPDYYVAESETPWYCFNDHSVSPALSFDNLFPRNPDTAIHLF